jgi:hypothetical protein
MRAAGRGAFSQLGEPFANLRGTSFRGTSFRATSFSRGTFPTEFIGPFCCAKARAAHRARGQIIGY